MKKFFNTLLCGVAFMNSTICENDMPYMAEISSELFQG